MKIELKNITVGVSWWSARGQGGRERARGQLRRPPPSSLRSLTSPSRCAPGGGGRLNIHPAYQGEFIYKEKLRNEVIHTVRKGFPLNTMYWTVAPGPHPPAPSPFAGTSHPEKGEGEHYELMDGQQRTISLCQYVHGDFSVEWEDGMPRYFHGLTPDQQRQILEYKLFIYVCDGEESEKLKWFEIINIASIKLTNQELRNAI